MAETKVTESVSGNWIPPGDARLAGVRDLGTGHLPLAPCVKDVTTGRVFAWHDVFAMRPDVFRCCDEHGNEEEPAWRGRLPLGREAAAPPPVAAPAPVPVVPPEPPHRPYSEGAVVGRPAAAPQGPPPAAPLRGFRLTPPEIPA
jgi:hypothetical protein